MNSIIELAKLAMQTEGGQFSLFLIILIALLFSYFLVTGVWCQLMRTIRVCAHGWPPPHCDDDGEEE